MSDWPGAVLLECFLTCGQHNRLIPLLTSRKRVRVKGDSALGCHSIEAFVSTVILQFWPQSLEGASHSRTPDDI